MYTVCIWRGCHNRSVHTELLSAILWTVARTCTVPLHVAQHVIAIQC